MKRRNLGSAVTAFALLATGCAVNRPVHVVSTPPSAKVFNGDRLIGITPLNTDINVLFPHRSYDFKASASTVLFFRKDGYEDASYTVSEFSVPDVIDVTLVPSKSAPSRKDFADRLGDLQALRDKGLISEDEYQKKRRAILDNL